MGLLDDVLLSLELNLSSSRCGFVIGINEAISAQAVGTHVITKGSSELPEFSQL